MQGDFPEAQRETLNAKKAFTVADIVKRARRLIENEISFGTTLMRAHVEVDPIIGMKAVEAILPLKLEYSSAITIQVI
jgi:cytosine deaminase